MSAADHATDVSSDRRNPTDLEHGSAFVSQNDAGPQEEHGKHGSTGDPRAAWMHNSDNTAAHKHKSGRPALKEGIGNPTGTGDPRAAWARDATILHKEPEEAEPHTEHAQASHATGDPRAAWMHQSPQQESNDTQAGIISKSKQDPTTGLNPTATGDPRRAWM